MGLTRFLYNGKDLRIFIFFAIMSAIGLVFVREMNQIHPTPERPKTLQVVYYDHVCKCQIKLLTQNLRDSSEFITFTSEGVQYQLDSSIVESVCIKF